MLSVSKQEMHHDDCGEPHLYLWQWSTRWFTDLKQVGQTGWPVAMLLSRTRIFDVFDNGVL